MKRYVRKAVVYAVSIGLASFCVVTLLSGINPSHAAAAAYNNDRNCTDASTEFNVVVVARVFGYQGNLKGYANNYTFHVNAFDNNMAYRDWGAWSATWRNVKQAGHDDYKQNSSGQWKWRDWGPWTWYNSNNEDGILHDQYSNEAKEFRRLKSESIRLWDNQYYYKSGINGDFAVQMNSNYGGSTAASDGMTASKGNACQVSSGAVVPAYAFRDGDNTCHRTLDNVNANSSPYGPLGICDQGHQLNNNSWSLSCLGQSDGSSPIKHMYFTLSPTWWDGSYVTSASAWTSRQAAAGGGTWSAPVTFWADNGKSVYAYFDYREPTPPVISPSANLNSTMEEGTNVTAQAFINNTTNSSGTASYTRQFWYEDNGNDTLDGDPVIGPGNYSGSAAFGPFSRPSLGDWGPYVIDGTHTRICTQLLITGVSNNGVISPGSNPSKDCRNITHKPYLSTYGGDVIAGAYPTSIDNSCRAISSAGVVSWNHNGAPDYAGAGGRAAVFAPGNIESFASGLNITTLQPTGLSFANTTDKVTGSQYGGGFVPVPSCDLGDATGATSLSGDQTIGGMTVGLGASNKKSYYVTGNVYISGNIAYQDSGSGWTKITDIPSFKLIAVGNIYIGSGVSELSGFYIAKTDSSGNGGEIYTCASGNGAPIPIATSANSCSTPLKIYGGFAARKIHFDRTYGSLSHATTGDDFTSDNAAEEFIFTPEMWLPNNTGQTQYTPKQYQGLPPVL